MLDEPTNHLDVDSREALILAINDYEGAVVLISHDRHIIETCADRLWLVNDGTVKPYDGDMDDYTQLVLDRARAARRTERVQASEPAVPAPAPSRPSRSSVQKRLQQLDLKIEETKEKISILDKALEDPTLYAEDARKAADFGRLRAKLADSLDQLETEWLEAHEQ